MRWGRGRRGNRNRMERKDFLIKIFFQDLPSGSSIAHHARGVPDVVSSLMTRVGLAL